MTQDVTAGLVPRVALVTGGLKLGGSTTFLCNFAGELIRRGIPAMVISFEKDNPLAADFIRQNIPVVCLNDRQMIIEDRLSFALRELARFKPSTVISTLGSASFEVQRYLPPGVFRIGMAQSDDPPLYPGIAKYAAWLDVVAVVSPVMKQKMAAEPPLARLPIHYLPYGVPIPAALDSTNRNNSSPLRILYLGRLIREQKRVQLFPKIWADLVRSGIPCRWTIAGDGPELAFLKATLKQGSAQQTVAFTGQVDYTAVPELLRRHDVFLLASDYEGLPLSLLEAMGHGLVPVVSDLPSGIRDVVNESSGIRVPVSDVAGYARGIIHLQHHREELAAKAQAAHARVKKEFSVEAMTNRWLAALPSSPNPIEPWPDHWRILPPVPASSQFWFLPPMRILRRAATGFRCYLRPRKQ